MSDKDTVDILFYYVGLGCARINRNILLRVLGQRLVGIISQINSILENPKIRLNEAHM